MSTVERPKWQKDLPMFFTYLRIALAPVILLVMYIPWSGTGWLGASLFMVASLTDWLDGHFARRFGMVSVAGQFMDPIADKMLVLSAIVVLLAMNRVDPVLVFLLLARDIFIGGLRAIAASKQIIIAAKPFGKMKTALQMVAVPCLFIYDPLWGIPLAKIGYIGLWVSVILSMVSAAEYSLGYYRQKT